MVGRVSNRVVEGMVRRKREGGVRGRGDRSRGKEPQIFDEIILELNIS